MVQSLIESVFRAESGRALATVAAITHSLDLAEDAVQEAFVDALRSWADEGIPERPGAWITTAARNRAIDRVRRESKRPQREQLAQLTAAAEMAGAGPESAEDHELQLLFTCCHPALARPARIALTLRLVFGLSAEEIARLVLDAESTVAQRLSRAKAKIRTAGIPLRVPPRELFAERLPSVLSCIYLTFTEGYAPAAGDAVIRADLCRESIRLARLVHRVTPEDSEAEALLALLLLQDSRRAARMDSAGSVIPIEDQDRDSWDKMKAQAGLAHLRSAAVRGHGPYLLQAVIACAHTMAPSFSQTDWATIVAAYDQLLDHQDSPVVRLNRAIALGFRDGYTAGLEELDTLAADTRLARSHIFHAARADLCRRAGRNTDAARSYEEALRAVKNSAVRAFLERRLQEVQSDSAPSTGDHSRI
ncbi:RNA polymerase sigma factor [Hoyosella subflava]|uniref:Putative sigma factor, includes region 2 n=1 Tax=Hoyosella subflava (strain DSM 45089 / JCM 17490 / NBRC 109087 / DQS3-9A1) TaxID=443218 RepID=F6EKK3_HOYSD|nr:putative sigma factor, includes region 2 [Hoyosella subflava DQS3-9A1]